jgi:aflatoxin B1 aldehyde reductase
MMPFKTSSPLAGGFLTGKVTLAAANQDSQALDRTRWQGEGAMAYYARVFDQPKMHEAILKLKAACDEASPPLSVQEAALRWLMHHSALQAGDAVVIGAKWIEQLQGNVADIHRGPLDVNVLKAVENMWEHVGGDQLVHTYERPSSVK